MQHQINTAFTTRDLLIRVVGVDDFIGLAGGAPREWFQGKAGTDLDFYIHDSEVEIDAEELLNVGFVNVEKLGDANYPVTQRNGMLCYVYYAELNNVMINIIVINERKTIEEVVETFPVSVSQAWFNFDERSIHLTNKARLSFATKTITSLVKGKPTVRDNMYMTKIISKLPDFTVKTFSEVALDLVGNATNSVPSVSTV